MKFVLETVSKNSGRLGHLVQAETGVQFKTPLLLQATKSGSIPHLSREVFDYVNAMGMPALQLTMASMNGMSDALTHYTGGGVGAYVGYPNCPTLMMIRDPCELMMAGGNDKNVVPLFTRHGCLRCTAPKYMEMIEAFQPDIYQGLNDADTKFTSSKKRVQKSVERTEQFMEYCYERQRSSSKLLKSVLYAPIVGGYNTFARTRSIKHAKTHGADLISGYLLEGFHSYGFTATEVSSATLLPVVEHCLTEIEMEKPKWMPGAYTPPVTLELIRSNIDMFDTSYAFCATKNFTALTFNFSLNDESAVSPESPYLDLTDDNLKDDVAPLLRGCNCLACVKHTRAYVHHLYKTKELLAPILLMIHNLHHYMQFFAAIRASIAADTLANLISLVKYQKSDKEVDYRIVESWKFSVPEGSRPRFRKAQTETESEN